ncbi:MAG: TetR/AcrR family transcriptional regulator [Solirubrobacteraceae bacterium]|nr:TetR/AcrR family transcriptional regulator [Solirubrobacteraceae bacterium]
MTSGQPKRSDAVRNRDRILDAAAKLLAQNPSASLLDVATAAGLSRATVYRHFSTMDDVSRALLVEVEDLGREVLKDGLTAAVRGDTRDATVSEQMLTMLEAALPVQTRYAETMAGSDSPEDQLLATFGPVLRATVVEGQNRGEYAGGLDPEATSQALLTLMILAGKHVHRDGAPVSDALEPVRTFLRGMQASPGPLPSRTR